jgi:hypothetical protein
VTRSTSISIIRRRSGVQISSADGHGPKEHHMSQFPSMSAKGAMSGSRRQDGGGAHVAIQRAVALLLLALAAWLVMAGHASSAWADDGCANAVLRAQNNSSGLPDCRAYEMVTPPYKEGFSIVPQTFSDDGAVAFLSTGVIDGGGIGVVSNQYLAKRSVTGWTTVAPNPPTASYDTAFIQNGAEAFSADLRQVLWVSSRHVAPVDDSPYYYYLTRSDGSVTRVGPGFVPGLAGLDETPFTQGASADLSHILFAHGLNGFGSLALAALYELVGTGNTAFGRPVSVDNDGQQVPAQACAQGMSVDGRVIFFASSCRGDVGQRVLQLWARVGGTATVAVSGSECTRLADDPAGACNRASSARFAGSAVDGSRVFFTTDQQLVNGDTDTTGDLYACDIPDGAPAPVGTANSCSALRQISGVTSSARVQSVPAVSEDGSRVYFVANGVLADNLGTSEAPAVDGHANLYLWSSDAAHPAGQIRFVADVTDPDPGAGGAPSVANARMTPDGRYVVFGTSAALINAGPGADTDNAADLYRYDAQTGALVRVSTGVSGSGGNTPGMDASNIERKGTMTSDGSMIVFVTAEALSPQDIDGVTDVYAWHDDGLVSLISDGLSGGSRAWVTPSGRDIFFVTGGRLTASDSDVNEDIYDARVDGGFHLTQPIPCSGDSCQGRPSLAPSLPGSAGESGDRGGEGVVPGFSLGAVSATQRRRLAQTGRLTLVIKTNTPGVVAVSGSVTGVRGAVGSVRKSVGVAGTVRLTVVLSKKARDRLAARGRLSVGLVVSHSKVALSRSMTLRLTHTKAKKPKAKARSVTRSTTKQSAGASGKGSRS